MILKKYVLIFLSGWLGIATSSCNETTEGCLDATATNFDASADTDCCCTYPVLEIRLSYALNSLDSSSFSTEQVFHDNAGLPYKINSLLFYISNVQLVRNTGENLGVNNTLTIYFENNTTQTVEDNYLVARTNTFLYEIGTFSHTGDFDKIRFNLGVGDVANHSIPDSLASTHPLAPQAEGMHLNTTDGYIFAKAEIITDTSTTTTTTYLISGDSNLITVELDNPMTIQTGFDTQIKINADFAKFFESVDFTTDDEATIQSKMITNASSVFSIVP